VKRFLPILGIVVVVAGLGWLSYLGNKRLKAMDNRIADLSTQVNEATQLAKEEAVAVNAASQRANEAATRAEIASGARVQAEQQKAQAEAGQAQAEQQRTQAETAAKRAADQAAQARNEMETMRKQREQELNQMQEALSRVVETRRTSNGMVMVLPDSIFKFDFDSADLKPKNRELLSRIAGILLVSKGYGLSVFGYTDDVGSAEYNQKLSERRADAVRNYLVHAGIDPVIVNTKGYGKTNPLVRGGTMEARAKNRRVEIALTDSEIKFGGEVAAP
jgi:outer membrane protein OmpA-like peptidoglycan-associated protein